MMHSIVSRPYFLAMAVARRNAAMKPAQADRVVVVRGPAPMPRVLTFPLADRGDDPILARALLRPAENETLKAATVRVSAEP